MKKSLSIITFLLLLLGGGFFGFSGAQNYTPLVDTPPVPRLQDMYRVNTMMKELPLIVARNTPILAFVDTTLSPPYQHPAAADDIYQLYTNEINDLLSQSQNFETLYQKVRIDVVKFLMERGYVNFNTQPYQEGNYAMVVQSGDFKVIKDITEHDALDALLEDALSGFKHNFGDIKTYGSYLDFKSIEIGPEKYWQLGQLFLFKNKQDLLDLGYELISWKSRKNIDREYRRHNIMAAFHNIGNVRLILSGETFNLASEIHYRPNQGDIRYVSGYATFGAGARMVYGGGLCGVATAFYQGTLTNLGLQLLQYSPHSTYYLNLFNAEINGIRVSTPGLDATIYSPRYNVKIKNIRDYPIIAVFNFGGGESDEEEMFTLSKPQDRGSFEFVGKSGKCFTWKINGKNQTNCYNYIKNF